MFLGLRSVMYPAADLQASKAWFSGLLGTAPYFDEPFYVGFNVGGYELGLIPAADGESTTYWGVPDAEVALSDLIAAGATLHSEVTDVGDGIRVATVREPAGSILGVIENPHFVISRAAGGGTGSGKVSRRARDAVLRQCGELAGAELCYPFGDEVAVFKVGGKMFAIVSLGQDAGAATLKCDPEEATALRESHAGIAPGTT